MKWIILMAFVLQCDITVGNYRFRQVNHVRIEKSWREVGDKCTLRLPKHVHIKGLTTSTLENYVKVGDPVKVILWYIGQPQHTEFEGYVKRVLPNTPFELECEDHSYYLRKTPVKKSWKKSDKVTLKQVIGYVISSVNAKFPAALTFSNNLPDVTFSEGLVIEAGNTAATVLQKIREEYGLTSYMKGRELYTGLAYGQTFGTVKLSLAWNIIFHELMYRSEDDILLKAKAIGIKKDNTKVVVDDVGDADGEQRTLYFYNVTDKSQLKKLAEEELKRLKYTGYEGDLTTFLYPYAEPLMVADLRDPQYGETRSGRYIIDSVNTEFGVYGARREVELGIKLTV